MKFSVTLEVIIFKMADRQPSTLKKEKVLVDPGPFLISMAATYSPA